MKQPTADPLRPDHAVKASSRLESARRSRWKLERATAKGGEEFARDLPPDTIGQNSKNPRRASKPAFGKPSRKPKHIEAYLARRSLSRLKMMPRSTMIRAIELAGAEFFEREGCLAPRR